MSYFPMYIDLENAKCLVIGGGSIAYRKVCVLLEFGACVTVIAEDIDERIRNCDEKVDCITAQMDDQALNNGGIFELIDKANPAIPFEQTVPLETYRLVIAATDDEELNHNIAELCKKKNIPVNAVDQQEDCTFIFPSYYKAGKFTMALTTSGSSPYYAAKLREKLQKEIPDMTEDFLEQMSQVRILVKERIGDSIKRGRILKKMVLLAMEQNRILTEQEITEFLENEKE